MNKSKGTKMSSEARAAERLPLDEALPTQEEQAAFKQLGLKLDELGRPLHPWSKRLLEEQGLELKPGKGSYHRWGPNSTVDPIVIAKEHVLLIVRDDTHDTGLPGGHVELGEIPELAALRELGEETDLTLPPDTPTKLVYHGPVLDPRATLNAWPETDAYLIELTVDELPPVKAKDDAEEVGWVPLKDVSPNLYGSHNHLLRLALAESARGN